MTQETTNTVEDTTRDELEYLFIKFARSVLFHTKQWLYSEGLLISTYLKCSFTENSYNIGIGEMKDYGTLLRMHLQDLLLMEETKQCVEQHLHADISPFFFEYNEIQRIMSIEVFSVSEQNILPMLLELILPIIECCKHEDILCLTDEDILVQYRRFRTLWDDDLGYIDVVFPLTNFFSNTQFSQQLSSHLSLALLTPADKAALWNDDALFTTGPIAPPLSAAQLVGLKWKLIGAYSYMPKNSSEINIANKEIINELGDVITALRLFKEGNIGAPGIYEKRRKPVLWQGTRTNSALPNLLSRQFSAHYAQYELYEAEVFALCKVIQALRKLRVMQINGKKTTFYDDMSVAFRRFNQSYDRNLPEDQIIDLTIALESSLLAGLKDELNYRLSLRGAVLLADAKIWEPSKSQALLKKMYDVRSEIVHNGKTLVNLEKKILGVQDIGIQPREFPQQCENIVRDILKEYTLHMAKGQSLEQVNADLDRKIVEGLIPPTHPVNLSGAPDEIPEDVPE